MAKNNSSTSSNLLTQSVYLFTTIVAFFSGVISAPIFMYLSNNYSDFLLSMGQTRLVVSLFIFWLMLTIIFAVFLAEVSGLAHPVMMTSPVKAKKKSKKS